MIFNINIVNTIIRCLALLFFMVFLSQCDSGVPKQVNKIVFEESQFAKPITLQLPCADPPEALENPRLIRRKDFNDVIMQFLIENNLAKIQRIHKWEANMGIWKYEILSYSNKLNDFIVSRESDNFVISVAKRSLKTISYTNNFTSSSYGVKTKSTAITFTYNIENKLPGLPNIDHLFQGKSVALLDPTDGIWKIDELSLEDRGADEYLAFLNPKYKNKINDARMAETIKLLKNKYRSQKDGIITDITTKLMWYRKSWQGISWTNAVELCNRLTVGGYNDWRLPTRRELSTIIDFNHGKLIDYDQDKLFYIGPNTILTSDIDKNMSHALYAWGWSPVTGWKSYGTWFIDAQALAVRGGNQD